MNSQPTITANSGRVIPLVPYECLTPEQQETLHAWFDSHGLDHTHIPINPRMRLQAFTLHVEVFATRDGKHYVGEDGEVVRQWEQFRMESPFPWPYWTAEWEQSWIQQRVQAAETPVGESR